MCISKTELDQRVKKIRNLKVLKAKVDEALEQFEAEVIDFLQEIQSAISRIKKESQSFSIQERIIRQLMRSSPARRWTRQRLKSCCARMTLRK